MQIFYSNFCDIFPNTIHSFNIVNQDSLIAVYELKILFYYNKKTNYNIILQLTFLPLNTWLPSADSFGIE